MTYLVLLPSAMQEGEVQRGRPKAYGIGGQAQLGYQEDQLGCELQCGVKAYRRPSVVGRVGTVPGVCTPAPPAGRGGPRFLRREAHRGLSPSPTRE